MSNFESAYPSSKVWLWASVMAWRGDLYDDERMHDNTNFGFLPVDLAMT